MKNDDEIEKELLEDLDFIYQSYRSMLEKGKTNIISLNTIIRALKETHKYYNYSHRDVQSKQPILDKMAIRKIIAENRKKLKT